jgi:hypothetical protein
LADAAIERPARAATLAGGTKFDPRRSVGFRRLVVWLTIGIGGMGFAYSWNGLTAAGTWAGVPLVAWAAPLAIDGFIIVATLAAIYKRSVGDSTAWAWSAVGLYTGISVVLNAMHALIEGRPDYEPLRMWVGVFVAALMPFSIWMATHLAVSILVVKPEAPKEQVKAQLKREIEEERAAEERRQLEERQEQQRREQEQRQRDERARAAAAREQAERLEQQKWDQLKNSKESSLPGTDEREEFAAKVLETYEGRGGRVFTRTAKLLGISENRVRSVVGEYELADTSR